MNWRNIINGAGLIKLQYKFKSFAYSLFFICLCNFIYVDTASADILSVKEENCDQIENSELRQDCEIEDAMNFQAAIEERYEEECKRTRAMVAPVKDLPTNEQKQQLRCGLSSNGYNTQIYANYYSENYEQARLCGYIEDQYYVLAMIYANGRDVQKNLDLAIHFACLGDQKLEEYSSYVSQLDALAHGTEDEQLFIEQPFSVCNTPSSEAMTNLCEHLHQGE